MHVERQTFLSCDLFIPWDKNHPYLLQHKWRNVYFYHLKACRYNCFLAYSFRIISSDFLRKWQVRCNIDWSQITDHIHPELVAKWLKVRCASAKPFWKKASKIILCDATKWYLSIYFTTSTYNYHLIGWKRGLEPSIFVSDGVRVRNHFEMRSHARIYCSPKGMKQCDSIDSSHCAPPILAHCAPLGSLSNYQLRSFFFR